MNRIKILSTVPLALPYICCRVLYESVSFPSLFYAEMASTFKQQNKGENDVTCDCE